MMKLRELLVGRRGEASLVPPYILSSPTPKPGGVLAKTERCGYAKLRQRSRGTSGMFRKTSVIAIRFRRDPG
ncbi:MAG: hypothetical protein AABP62_18270 [Planctomycetota bacterium]